MPTTFQDIESDLKEHEARMAEMQNEAEEQAKIRNQEKLAKAKAFKATGDIIHDARAYFEIGGVNIQKLDSPYREAFENNDRQGILKFFKANVQVLNNQRLDLLLTSDREYRQEIHRIVKEIINAAETKS